MSNSDKLSQIFAALANPTRRAILTRLVEGEATGSELAVPLGMSLPALSKHIKVLEQDGLIRQVQKAQYGPCTIDVSPLLEISRWTEQYRHIWETRYDRIDNYIHQLKHKEQDNE